MIKNPLHIVSTDNQPPSQQQAPSKRAEIEARFDRIWLQEPQQLDPSCSAMSRERVARTVHFLQQQGDISGYLAVDLGCGNGYMTRQLRDLGLHMHAVDISYNALKELQKKDHTNIKPIQDYMPKSMLSDDCYDIVVAADLIAYLDPKEYRLFFSELARIIKEEGLLACSTPIDIYSEGGLQKFIDYVLTEFTVDKCLFSYNYLLIRCLDFFKAPGRFAKARADKNYRKRSLEERVSVNRWWFKLNSSPIIGFIWSAVQYLMNPIAHFLENSPKTIKILEKISKSIWNDSAISHVVVIGKRKVLMPPTLESMQPREPKHKKQLWE